MGGTCSTHAYKVVVVIAGVRNTLRSHRHRLEDLNGS
jgi:hypothetical protein